MLKTLILVLRGQVLLDLYLGERRQAGRAGGAGINRGVYTLSAAFGGRCQAFRQAFYVSGRVNFLRHITFLPNTPYKNHCHYLLARPLFIFFFPSCIVGGIFFLATSCTSLKRLVRRHHSTIKRLLKATTMTSPSTISPKFLSAGNELGVVAVGFSGGQVSAHLLIFVL